MMSTADNLKLAVDALGNLLVPLVLVFLGQWFVRSKERTDSARQNTLQIAAFLEHLSSENKARRKLSLLALAHMRDANLFPEVLYQSIESIASVDDPEVAAFAELALGRARLPHGLGPADRTALLELLLPAKLHFERSRAAFDRWVKQRPSKPNLEIEDAIKASNTVIASLLRSKWHVVPYDLQEDALLLLQHYDAWLAEYNRLRPNGVRDPNVPYVFVGPKGFPFPVEAERHFLSRYAELAGGATVDS